MPTLRLYEENRPYWLKSVGTPYAVSEEPLYLQFDEDGAVRLSTQEGQFLAVTKLGIVRLTGRTSGLTTRFRFGREPLLALYPNGDQNRPLMLAGGKLLCAYRKLQRQDDVFARRISFVLVREKPEHVKFLLK